jgi:hypothetical protein
MRQRLRIWPSLVFPILCLSFCMQRAAAQCTTPTGMTFTESFGDASNSCWPGGPAGCNQAWQVVSGSNYSIAASPAGAAANTACANSLLLSASAAPASLQTSGTIPYLAPGTTVDLYFTLYIVSAPSDFSAFLQPQDANSGAAPVKIIWRNSGGTLAFAEGATTSNPLAIALNSWHTVQLHIDATPQNSFLAIDGGVPQSFTASAIDINSIAINGNSSGSYYIGNMYINSPGFGPTGMPMLTDFAGSTNGAPITSAAMNAGSHCVNDAGWVVKGADLSGMVFTNSQAEALHTSVLACGASYSGTTGLSVRYDLSKAVSATYSLETLSPSVSVGFFYMTTLASTDQNFFCNANLTGSLGDYTCVHTHGNGSSLQIWLEVYVSPELFGPPINISPNTWYWITVQYNAGGTHHLQVYETQNWTLVGSIDGPSSFGVDSASRFFFGHTGSNYAPTSDYLFFSNIELDWVNAKFPLGPGGGNAPGPPAIVSANTAIFPVGAPDTFTVTAIGTPTPTLSETGTLPNGISFSSATGVLSGTPAAGTVGTYPIAFIAQNGISPIATQNFTLAVGQAPAITSGNSTTFTAATPGTFTVTTTGFPAPTFSESGALPSGVTLDSSTGVLSGMPTAGTGGNYAITITAQNGVSPNATQNFTLTTFEAAAITSATSATFTAGLAGTFTVTTRGFPAPAISESGALPSGVTFNASTNVLSGTPAPGTAGSYPITFTAHNGIGADAVQTFTLVVGTTPPVAFVRAAGNSGESNRYTVAIAPSTGDFLVALVWQEEGAATPSVTDNVSSVYTKDCDLTYDQGFGLRRLTVYHLLKAGAAITGVRVTPNKPSRAIVAEYSGMPSTAALDVCGAVNTQNTNVTSWASQAATTTATDLVFGLADTGMTANAGYAANAGWQGRLAQHDPVGVDDSFMEDQLNAGAGSYTATGTSTSAVAEASVVVAFRATSGPTAPTITSATNATFTVGMAGSFTVTATGSPTPTFNETGALPNGVSFNSSTGVLGGTPATGSAGSYPLTVTAQNGILPNAAQNFTLTVGQTPAITSSNSTTFTAGTAGTFTVTAMGFPAPTFSETGALPSGVTLDSSTGVLSGTPAAGTGGNYAVTITASNGALPNATQGFTLTIDQVPAISSGSSAMFTVGAAGTFVVAATGFPAPTITEAGALPNGVSFNAMTAVLSGTPGAGTTNSYPITFTAHNGVGADATQGFTLTVGPGNQAPVITSGNSAAFTVAKAGLFTATATGSPAPTFSESGALPSGVTFTSGGVLRGTPAAGAGGNYAFTITSSNGVLPNATQGFTLTVNQAAAVTSGTSATFTVGMAGTFTVTASGFPTPTITEAGALPNGVSFNATTGLLSGTPGAGTAGVYPISFTAHNGIGADATQGFTLTVNVPSASSVTFVRAAGRSSSSAAYTVTLSPAAGDFLTVFVWQEEGAGTPAVSDNVASGYTKDCDLTYDQGFGLRRLTVFHLLKAGAKITGIRVTPNKASRAIVAEYSGMTSTASLDVCGAVNAQNMNVTSWTSQAAATTGTDLVFGLADTGMSGNAGYAATGAWHGRLAQHDLADADDSFLEDQLNVAAGSLMAAGTTTQAVREASVVIAYRVQ